MPRSIANKQSIVDRMIAETGIDPRNIYCQFTGQIIGHILPSELDCIFAQIEAMDEDAIIDDLYMRTIASMRPSPAWNYVRRETYNELREANPVALASFILGRLWRPKRPAKDKLSRNISERIYDGAQIIKINIALKRLANNNEAFLNFLHFLIELDAKFNVSNLPTILNLPMTPDDLRPDQLENYCQVLSHTIDKLVVNKQRLEKQAQLQQSYLSHPGNRPMAHVYYKSFMERAPKSDAAIERKLQFERERRVAFLLAASAEEIAAVMQTRQAPTPKPKPEKFVPKQFASGLIRINLINGAAK